MDNLGFRVFGGGRKTHLISTLTSLISKINLVQANFAEECVLLLSHLFKECTFPKTSKVDDSKSLSKLNGAQYD